MIGETLLAACISNIARTRALGLLSLSGLPASIRNNFETLGSLRYHEEGKAPVEEFSFYRLLHEDPGFEVWSAGDLTDYLKREYERLALAREIRTVRDMGETRSGTSLFSAEVHRDRRAVTLRPHLARQRFFGQPGAAHPFSARTTVFLISILSWIWAFPGMRSLAPCL